MANKGNRKFRERDKLHIEQAAARHMKRAPVVDALVDRGDSTERWNTESPYADADSWEILLFDAFGTNSRAACETFVGQLSNICGTYWDPDNKNLWPDDQQLSLLISIIRDLKPRNSAEAAMAAQMCAVHLASMKMAEWAVTGNAQSASILSRLARTYAQQMETFALLRGKTKRSKQTIKVINEKHVHQHKHVHIEGGGQENEGQPCEPKGTTKNQTIESRAFEASSSLPGPDAPGNGLPMPRDERKETVSDSRRQKSRRSKG